ncbi:MAG: hypothetical protein AB1430_03905 [Pseudomonadota bacterium]
MIKNLPETFPISAIEEFHFGDAEAKDDGLLSTCPVPTAALREFLEDRKDIVLGYRGTGKSAIVRLIVEQKVSFRQEEGFKALNLALDEEYNYRSIREHLEKHATEAREKKLVCRVVWEVLILYSGLKLIISKFDDCDTTLRQNLEELESLLGISTRVGVFQLLLSHKKKIGVKFDALHPNIVDFYAGLDPSSDASAAAVPTIRLGEYKKNLNDFLERRRTNLYVLFDRLDDFVIQEDYDTQKLLLQGLLAAQNDCRGKYLRIRIKTFFRTDLFRRLDLNEFGPDKILPRCVELTWTHTAIRQLIAKRVAHNLISALRLKSLEISVDDDQFHITRAELERLHEVKLTIRNFNVFRASHWKRLWWYLNMRSRSSFREEGRKQSSLDVVNTAIITSAFPRSVLHKKRNGSEASIDIFEYLESHFQFAHGHTTPRAILTFLSEVLSATKKYYAENIDITSLKRDPNGEYPLFLKSAIKNAYEQFRKHAWDVQYHWAANEWRPFVATIQNLGSPEFTFEVFAEHIPAAEQTYRHVLAFLDHTGLINCENPHERLQDRRYRMPIMFQRCTDE